MDNYNYPAGADNSSAPWNQHSNSSMEFDVLVTQTLSKVTSVHTDDYIEGEPDYDVDYDEDGHRMTTVTPGSPDTSDTNWADAFYDEHCTALDIINELKRTKEEYLKQCETALENTDSDFEKCRLKKHIRQTKRWIDECDGWEEDDIEIGEN